MNVMLCRGTSGPDVDAAAKCFELLAASTGIIDVLPLDKFITLAITKYVPALLDHSPQWVSFAVA